MSIKSGPVVFNTGERGVFINEEDLGRAGDAFRYFVRINYEKAKELDDNGYKVYSVMWHLLNGQKNHTAYSYVERQFLTLENTVVEKGN